MLQFIVDTQLPPSIAINENRIVYCARSGFEEKDLTLTGLWTLSGRWVHHLSVCEAADRLKTQNAQNQPAQSIITKDFDICGKHKANDIDKQIQNCNLLVKNYEKNSI